MTQSMCQPPRAMPRGSLWLKQHQLQRVHAALLPRGEQVMCSRIVSWTWGAIALVALLTTVADAQAPRRVKIYRGPALISPTSTEPAAERSTDPSEYSPSETAANDNLSIEAPWDEAADFKPTGNNPFRPAVPTRLAARRSSAAVAQPTNDRSPPESARPLQAEPLSLTGYDSTGSLLDEASWGADDAATGGGEETFGEQTTPGDQAACGCGSSDCGALGGDSCGCDSCPLDGSACYRPYGLYAGVEATYLRANYYTLSTGGDSNGFGYNAAPRLWLGWQTRSGWGIRGRYWDFDANKQQSVRPQRAHHGVRGNPRQ